MVEVEKEWNIELQVRAGSFEKNMKWNELNIKQWLHILFTENNMDWTQDDVSFDFIWNGNSTNIMLQI